MKEELRRTLKNIIRSIFKSEFAVDNLISLIAFKKNFQSYKMWLLEIVFVTIHRIINISGEEEEGDMKIRTFPLALD